MLVCDLELSALVRLGRQISCLARLACFIPNGDQQDNLGNRL